MKIINGWLQEQTQHIDMPKRKLGKTGLEVSIFSLGGQGVLEDNKTDRKLAIEIIQEAYELGVNYFDTAPAYGPSEELYGEAMGSFRDKIVLATKTDTRDRDGSLKLLEKSLKRLKTDYIDIWQVHHLSTSEEVFQVTGKDGALEAMLQMKEEGVVKHIGITGHAKPRVLLQAMEEYDWETVLCPINPADHNMKEPFVTTVVAEANRKGIGIIGMKIFAQGYMFHPNGITSAEDLVSYALSQPVSTIIAGHDTKEQLRENVAIAKVTSLPIVQERIQGIIDKADSYKKAGAFFRAEYGDYKSIEKLGSPHAPIERVEQFKDK